MLAITAPVARAPAINLSTATIQAPLEWNSKLLSREHSGNEEVDRFKIYVPPTAAPTRPYWHRNDPETEALNTSDDAQYQGLPFPPPPLTAMAFIPRAGMMSAVCMVRYKDASGAIAERPLAVAPPFSVMLDTGDQVIPTEDGPQSRVKVNVSSNLDSKTLSETHCAADPQKNGGVLQVAVPENWRVEPAERLSELHERHEKQSTHVKS